jgi:tetratricopeptide (TPR) repeat protein
MPRKPLSSLDYETLLHELSLKGFGRAIHERDMGRALSYAGKLAESTDRFWRWQGLLDVSTIHILKGRASSALQTLDQAKALYRDVPELQTPPEEQKAFLLLELGRTQETSELARSSKKPSPFLLYLGGLADRKAKGELALGELREAVRPLAEREGLASPAGVYLLDELASGLLERGERAEAQKRYQEISESEDAALAAPICFVRAFAKRGTILAASGDPEAARSAWTTFLSFWNEGELAPDLVAEARRLVGT